MKKETKPCPQMNTVCPYYGKMVRYDDGDWQCVLCCHVETDVTTSSDLDTESTEG